MESDYTRCQSCGCPILQRTSDRYHGLCKNCGMASEARKQIREQRSRRRRLVPICEEDWLRVSPNGTLEDEANALGSCLYLLSVSSQQVVLDWTEVGCSQSRTAESFEQIAHYLQSHLIVAEEETICDFLSKNCKPYPISPLLTSPEQFVPITNAQLSHIFRDDTDAGWDRFRLLFPRSSGCVSFSRIGFNHDITQALAYAGKQVDSLIGHGTYWLLKRSQDKWEESENTMAWIS